MSTIRALTQETSKLQDIALVVLSSILIGLCGKFSIPLPFTPVPLILQDTLILSLAILLGPKRAAAATFLFLAQGAFGLPVFANGGAAGFLRFFGPTGGYLIGYLIAACVTGSLMERFKERTALNTLLAFLAGNAVIFLCGAAYLSTFVGVSKAFLLGVVPFIPGNLLKTCAAIRLIRKC